MPIIDGPPNINFKSAGRRLFSADEFLTCLHEARELTTKKEAMRATVACLCRAGRTVSGGNAAKSRLQNMDKPAMGLGEFMLSRQVLKMIMILWH